MDIFKVGKIVRDQLIFLLAFTICSIATAQSASHFYNTCGSKNRGSSQSEATPSGYKPNYFLPGYYNEKLDTDFYHNASIHTSNEEIKFQLSFKVPLWVEVLGTRSVLYAAYTQLSYWQAYHNNSAFFRETNYAPELFFHLNFKKLDIDWGAIHESNGQGGFLERSWNRVYFRLGVGSEQGAWHLSIEPWYIIKENSLKRYNPDISNFLGDGEMTLELRFFHNTFAFMIRNVFESHFKRGAEQFEWSFPLPVFTKRWCGFVQVFSGYGQSLAEYNHYTNAVGAGLILKL